VWGDEGEMRDGGGRFEMAHTVARILMRLALIVSSLVLNTTRLSLQRERERKREKEGEREASMAGLHDHAPLAAHIVTHINTSHINTSQISWHH
jgi:hypothetical protein